MLTAARKALLSSRRAVIGSNSPNTRLMNPRSVAEMFETIPSPQTHHTSRPLGFTPEFGILTILWFIRTANRHMLIFCPVVALFGLLWREQAAG